MFWWSSVSAARLRWYPLAAELTERIDDNPVTINAQRPAVRDGTGGVLGAARHSAARVSFRPAITSVGPYRVISSWVISYQQGDFNALHTDRPDSDATALLALDDGAGPLVVCHDLAEASDEELVAIASRCGHPDGDSVQLRHDEFLVLPAHVPHHRPPAALTCQILSLSLVRQQQR